MRKKKKQYPLKWSMISMLVCGWLLPLLVLAGCMLYFMSAMISNQIEKTILLSTDKAVEICDMQLQEVVTASKNASYISTVRDSYREYQQEGRKQKLHTYVTSFLHQQYKYDRTFLCTMIFMLDDPREIYFTYNTYDDNNSGNSGYQRVLFFKYHLQDKVIVKSRTLDTRIILVEEQGHLYLIRNLVDSSFKPYGMIVMELDAKEMYGSLESIWGKKCYDVYIDGKPLFGGDIAKRLSIDESKFTQVTQGSVYEESKETPYTYKVEKVLGQYVAFLVELDSESMIDEFAILRSVALLVAIFLIPLVYMIFRFFHVKLTRPVAELVDAAKQIAKGDYGYQVEVAGGSEELVYLDMAFNHMSSELKYQFETIYKEELALKDASIKALQSQINPHFLNNTLEIINWEARMNGNDKVSAMIEALATMLNATMNRRQRRFVPLSEELSYVDSYLYIISQRYGDNFHVERDIDESLLDIPIPILIIQPIVENAVEHGAETSRRGTVSLRIYAKEDKLYIEVANDGVLTPADRDKIDRLLGDGELGAEEKHVSLGIRNVNSRLKIIYGEDSGLTIHSDEKNRTVSTIIVKLSQEGNKSQ